jgi:hypothetical protein
MHAIAARLARNAIAFLITFVVKDLRKGIDRS